MRELETEKDKVQRICDMLRKDTLLPAQEEAEKIIEGAKREAAHIIEKAKQHALEIESQTKKNIEIQGQVFESAMSLSFKQTMEKLRQQIEKNCLKEDLQRFLQAELNQPKVIAKLIEALIAAFEADGVDADLEVFVSSHVPPREINEILAERFLKRLKDHSVLLGSFGGGIQLKIEGDRVTYDLTDRALAEMLSEYLRRDFRDLFFTN